MKRKNDREITYTKSTRINCLSAVLLAGIVAVTGALPARADEGDGGYQQVNLVADLPGVAMLQDTNLVNAWGMSFNGSSPFWISDNGSGLATLYAVTNDTMGVAHVSKVGLEVSIPGGGTPTGQLFNGTGAFHGDIFIFAGEDGTISGWRGSLGTAAELLVTQSNAVYKAITLDTNGSSPVLLAANFRSGTVDVYDTSLSLAAQLMDSNAPAGYAPFNVQSLGGMVFVTFAKQDDAKHDDVPGMGHGLIDVLDVQTGMFHRIATGSDAGGKLRQINSPWGLALSPSMFGSHGDQLLVGNFGSGTIMSFDADAHFRGLLEGRHEKPIVIDGLWGLAFGNGGRAGVPGTLYFTAGPDGESHGLFGSLAPVQAREHGRSNDHDDGGHDSH